MLIFTEKYVLIGSFRYTNDATCSGVLPSLESCTLEVLLNATIYLLRLDSSYMEIKID